MLSVKKFYDLVLPKMILQKAIVSFRLADLMLDNSLNPLAPDRFTPSRARRAENCGSALTHRLLGKK